MLKEWQSHYTDYQIRRSPWFWNRSSTNCISHELLRRDIFSVVQIIFIGSQEQYHDLKQRKPFRRWHQQTFEIRVDIRDAMATCPKKCQPIVFQYHNT
jgi:hypothetical protein